MSAQPSLKSSPCQRQIAVAFAGEPLVLDASGAAFFPTHDTLLVSDLHLEKGSFFAARGNPIPCYDTRDTLARLERAIACYRPSRVISLGDSFHDIRAGERISPADNAQLDRLMASVTDWIWVTGNHDPDVDKRFRGAVSADYRIGPISLAHQPDARDAPLIAGHFHPKHRFRASERSVSGPCFILGTELMLMPAFGAYAGGLNSASEPIAALFARQSRQHILIYGGKLWAIE